MVCAYIMPIILLIVIILKKMVDDRAVRNIGYNQIEIHKQINNRHN